MAIIEGATNPEIKNGTRYEYCTFDGLEVGLDENLECENLTYESIVFENCDFIDCDFVAVMWHKCEWVTSYAHDIGIYSNIFAKCKVDMQVNFSRVKGCVSFGSFIKLGGSNEYKEEITYI